MEQALMMTLHTADLGRLNSLTKYPTIPTYHAMGEKGRLTDAVLSFDSAATGAPTDTVVVTEKIDGTNARMIVLPDGMYVLGSREDLLYARGDIIGNPALGIVDALKPIAERVARQLAADAVGVIYGEVYGGTVSGASKQYTGTRQIGFRVFDVAWITDYAALLECPREDLARWREHGGQPFLPYDGVLALGEQLALDVVPHIAVVNAADLPQDIDATYAWLHAMITRSDVTLDDTAGGRPEGVVIRSWDRSRIAKVRFEDYVRTLGRQGGHT